MDSIYDVDLLSLFGCLLHHQKYFLQKVDPLVNFKPFKGSGIFIKIHSFYIEMPQFLHNTGTKIVLYI